MCFDHAFVSQIYIYDKIKSIRINISPQKCPNFEVICFQNNLVIFSRGETDSLFFHQVFDHERVAKKILIKFSVQSFQSICLFFNHKSG